MAILFVMSFCFSVVPCIYSVRPADLFWCLVLAGIYLSHVWNFAGILADWIKDQPSLAEELVILDSTFLIEVRMLIEMLIDSSFDSCCL